MTAACLFPFPSQDHMKSVGGVIYADLFTEAAGFAKAIRAMKNGLVTLVNIENTIGNHNFFMGKSTISMAMFNSIAIENGP